ncbi:MAG: NAD(P)-binding domain-containing protein [Myxococcota bacterium]
MDDLPALLSERPMFQDLRGEHLASLLSAGELLDLKPNQPIIAKSDAEPRLFFVIAGQIGVVRSKRLGIESALRKSHLPNPGREYLLHFVDGDFFSDRYFRVAEVAEEMRLSCVAVMHSSILSVPERWVKAIMKSVPMWAARLREHNAEIQRYTDVHHAGELRLVQDFFLQHNFSYAQTLKIIDLDRCIGCDGCERACADRHGVARLVRKGPVLGRLAFPVACRTCVDHRCYDACGFDAISILAPKEEVKIDVQKCVGCAACYSACPNDVITMQEKPYVGADFKEQLPWTDLEHRTNVPGLFLTGEATGTALIKLAINSGRKAVEVASQEIGDGRGGEIADVIIVGAGPAGLSAGLTAQEMGLNYLMFDKGHFATTINSYPRHKVVMAEPMHIPLFGNLWLKDTTKEELIGHWKEIIEKTGLVIQSNEQVSDVQRQADGSFEVTTVKGKYRAKKVVLATGTRGSPRKLDVEGEVEPRVQYLLTEPGDYRGKHCLVVGGGDSAVEGAMSLADVPGTTVTISYRKDSFGRIKPRNKTRLDEMTAAGKVTVIFDSAVKAIKPSTVVIKTKEGNKEIKNDNVFAMLGGEPPTKFFEKIGIKIIAPATPEMDAFAKSRGNRRYASKCDHCSDHSDQACIQACPTGAIMEIKPEEVFAKVPVGGGDRTSFHPEHFSDGIERLAATSTLRWAGVIGSALALLIATVIGLECFLRRMYPESSFLAYWQTYAGKKAEVGFYSGEGLGYYLGIAGTTLMFLTALYPLHSRLGLFRKVAKTPFWLAGHVLAGLIGPVFVTYHTTLKLNRWPSVAFWLMWIVVMSGVIGRHVYRWIRSAYGLTDMEAKRIEDQRQQLLADVSGRKGHTQIFKVLDRQGAGAAAASSAVSSMTAIGALIWAEVTATLRALWLRWSLRGSGDDLTRRRAVEVMVTRLKKEQRAVLLERIGQSAALWRRVHLFATIVMFMVAIAHITAALLLKGM